MSNIELDTPTLFPEVKDDKKEKSSHIVDEKAAAYWKKCLKIIHDNVSTSVYKTWFEPITSLKWQDNQLFVKVPSQFFSEWIEEHFYQLLQKTVAQVLGKSASLQYHIVVDEGVNSLKERTIHIPAFKHAPPGSMRISSYDENKKIKDYPTYLNSRYTFNNFVKGESNQLAYSAGLAVSKNPGGTRFNPLVIYGDTGLGKTHLVQGIGNNVILKNRNARVLYTTSERFTMEFVNAIQNNSLNGFINLYRSIDVLIVDDIQFFGGKEKTQDNFFHTFNALHQAGKQLILTSDKPPRELRDVDERLISRFQWGLIVDIQAPDFEMRMAILQKKSADEGLELDGEVVEYVARHVRSSIRELEGVLISLFAKVTLDGRECNLALAKEVVHGIGNLERRQLTIDDIKELVSQYYQIAVKDIESKSRKHEIALARQMAIYLTKQLTQLSLKSIGSHFSDRDHSTVLHSIQTIENYLITDKSVKISFDNLLKKLRMD